MILSYGFIKIVFPKMKTLLKGVYTLYMQYMQSYTISMAFIT